MSSKWYLDDVPRLMQETDELYARIVQKRPDADKISLTKQKIIDERKWSPSLHRYKHRFDKVLQELNYFYVPKNMEPGPIFVFPIKDIHGQYTTAQTKPMEGSALYGKSKYRYIGSELVGPRWIGNSPNILRAIMQYHCVLVVEGAFDLLAIRLLCPEIPSISPLTKFLGKGHIDYLRMLGVKHLYLMYDNEEAEEGKQTKGGKVAMEFQSKQIKSMEVHPIICTTSDASEALEDDTTARTLRERLSFMFPQFYSISTYE